jgi:hypothetical protein
MRGFALGWLCCLLVAIVIVTCERREENQYFNDTPGDEQTQIPTLN